MEDSRNEHVQELARLYRLHFQAANYREGHLALEQAEAFQTQLVEKHGAEYAREIDRLAYAIGHG